MQRPQVNTDKMSKGLGDLVVKLRDRLDKKGYGSYASRHEILGILSEEMNEVIDAATIDSAKGYQDFADELMDVAVGAIFGYICVKSGYIRHKE